MKKKYWHAIGLGWMFATYLAFIITFVIAYLSPQKAVIFYINRFKEAHIEMILTTITFPIIIWHSVITLKQLRESQ